MCFADFLTADEIWRKLNEVESFWILKRRKLRVPANIPSASIFRYTRTPSR